MKHLARILKELEECNTEQDSSGITLSLKPDNLTRLVGSIAGPLGTPYEGGSFQIHIALPGAYPYEPPRMKFITKICIFVSIRHSSIQLVPGQKILPGCLL
ncbi:hypothetical protein V6Z11_D11G044300 [Gossypium hirsutum]